MSSQLTWSALILACLAAIACWKPEAPPACRASRPVYGAGACCEIHRASGNAAAYFEAAEADRQGRVNSLDLP